MSHLVHPVEWFGHHQAVYCFGDNDVLLFDGIACEDREAGVAYSCRAEVIPGQFAQQSLNDDGSSLAAGILVALVSQAVVQHIYHNGVFEFLWNIAQHAGNFVTGGGQRTMPILLFRLGALDCQRLGGEEAMPERIREAIAPYVRALVILKERGLQNTFACSVSTHNNPSVAATFNAMLGRLLQEAGVAYLDVSGESEADAPRCAIELLLKNLQAKALA